VEQNSERTPARRASDRHAFRPGPAGAAASAATADIHQVALDILGRREHARRELARRLRRRGFSREAIDSELNRLEGAGLVSDERYARLFVRDRLAVNPQGRRRILGGLRAKGIGSEVAAAAIDEVYRDRGISETEAAERLARKRVSLMGDDDPVARRRRLAGYLARRGFAPDAVSAALRSALEALPDVEQDEAADLPGDEDGRERDARPRQAT
jgi:regulatory protein